jgi:hypothetical protein
MSEVPATRKTHTKISSRGWAIIVVTALVTPLLFGVWPDSFSRLFRFLMLAWIGGFMAGAAVLILGSSEAPPAATPVKPDDTPG